MITTLTCPIPDTVNPLSPTGFQFSIRKLPELTYFAQQVNLPGLTLGMPEQNTPFSVAPIPGEMLTYDALTVQFMVDESMRNYKAIHNWLVGLGFPEDNEQYKDIISAQSDPLTSSSETMKNYSDATLEILGSNNTSIQTIQFVDLFPISLDSLIFQSNDSDVTYIIGNANFRYSYYKFLN